MIVRRAGVVLTHSRWFSVRCVGLAALLLVSSVTPLHAQPLLPDLSDPWGASLEDPLTPTTPTNKSAEELTNEAEELLEGEHLLEARATLMNALRKDPSYYPAYLNLGFYYMAHVAHFRLAMKYIKAGERLFLEQNGPPPYSSRSTEARHAQILYLLSQARLNLDDYSGALAILDDIKARGYITQSYASSRAWVLMKLGRIEEAIKEAKVGLLMRAEPTRTLNMLGILLSMNGEPESALEALKRAAKIEQSLGKQGQPATPTNNMGEVYKEMFEDDKAEASWIKTKSFHDGCEHVLPSLNLALLYLDQLRLVEAQGAIDSFLSCVAQYTLRSDEEHRALVNLAEGRFNLHAGNPGEALKKLENAYENIQWFGKIGTNQDDLEVGITITKAQAWEALANRLSFQLAPSIRESITNHATRIRGRIISWWLYRKAGRVLAERLRNIEDLTIRNTDSLIEYSTFGSVLSRLPTTPFERRLGEELARDHRPIAQVYYAAYRGENLIRHGKTQEGFAALQTALQGCRPRYDDGLRLRILLLLASLRRPTSAEYLELTEQIFALWPPALRNAGLPLPVTVTGGDRALEQALEGAGFVSVAEKQTPFTIIVPGGSPREITLQFAPSSGTPKQVSAKGDDLRELANQLGEAVFSVALVKK